MSSAEDAGNKTVASEEEVKLDEEMVKEHPEFADVDEAKRIRFLRVSIYQEYLYKTLQGILLLHQRKRVHTYHVVSDYSFVRS